MTRIRKDTKANITIINNTVIRDAELSWKARGIFVYLWSLPEDWDFYEKEIIKHATDGKDSTKSGLHELEAKGYLTRTRSRNDKGQVKNYIWVLHENPQPKSEKPTQENPAQEKPVQGNPQLLNTNLTKHESNKTLTKQNKGTEDKPPVHPPYREIITYLNRKTGTTFRYSSKSNQSLINARFNEGYNLDDFKQVIDNKVSSWSNSEKMAKFLRPSTLFAKKHFEEYLQEKRIKSSTANPDYDFTQADWQANAASNSTDDLPF